MEELIAGNGIIIEDGVISVDTTLMIEADNPLPVASMAVYDYCSDIETLLANI